MSGIEHDEACQLPRCRCCDDLAAKSPLGKERQSAAMIQVSMCKEDLVDASRIKAEWLLVFLLKFTAPLVHSTIDENPFAATLDHMTRASDAPIRAVE